MLLLAYLRMGSDPEGCVKLGQTMRGILETTELSAEFASFIPGTVIGLAMCHLDRPNEAEPWLREAHDDMQMQTGGEHPLAGWLYEAFGLMAARRGQWDEAGRYFDDADAVHAAYCGAQTIQGARALGTRALAEIWRGRYGEAAALARRQLLAAEASVRRDNVITAARAQKLAVYLRRAGELTEAEEAYRYWDSIAERVEIPVSSAPHYTRYWFARVLWVNGKIEEAAEQYRQADSIFSLPRARRPDDAQGGQRAGVAALKWAAMKMRSGSPARRWPAIDALARLRNVADDQHHRHARVRSARCRQGRRGTRAVRGARVGLQ